MKIPKINFLLFGLLVAISSFLTVESFLNLSGKSLCATQGCKIVGNYLRFPESLFVAFGAVFFWMLIPLSYFTIRYERLFLPFALVILTVSLIFDGSIIGFQFFLIKTKCVLCIVVATSLVFISIIFCIAHRLNKLSILVPVVWIVAFSSMSIFNLPVHLPSRTNAHFYDTCSKISTCEQKRADFTLFFSINCPHCHDVLAFLAKQDTYGVSIKLATVDQDRHSLSIISQTLRDLTADSNIFETLAKSSDSNIAKLQSALDNKLKTQSNNAMNLTKTLGYNSIPYMIVDEGSSKETIYNGSVAILGYLNDFFTNTTKSN